LSDVGISIDRVKLAREAYAKALGEARGRSTPHTWRRLVRAGQNLREAVSDARAAAQPRSVAAPRVLLVEDDAATRDALRDILAGERIEVWTASDGEEALRLLASTQARPTVIVLDLVLPGMNGQELCERLRRIPRLADVPVLAMSGHHHVRVHGARLFEKPFDPSDLVEAVFRLARSA
jgi:CheY-like chemotaxis protein